MLQQVAGHGVQAEAPPEPSQTGKTKVEAANKSLESSDANVMAPAGVLLPCCHVLYACCSFGSSCKVRSS